MSRIDEALDGISARDAEELKRRLEQRLEVCAACGGDGAAPVKAQARLRGNEVRMSLRLCPACIERHRLPESRAL
jgi:RNase P subunit RPR2